MSVPDDPGVSALTASAVAVHHTDTTTAAWDGPAQVKKIPADAAPSKMKMVFAWQDSSAGANPDAKSSYKFPHHMVGSDGTAGAANLKACSSGIGILNGGMGGAKIPSGDVKGVYGHLAAHLRDGKVDVPDLNGSHSHTHEEGTPDHTHDDTGEVFVHGSFTGTHTHPHPTYGEQGGDQTHEHTHVHDGDRTHAHNHSLIVPSPTPKTASGLPTPPLGWTSFTTRPTSDTAGVPAGALTAAGTVNMAGASWGISWDLDDTGHGFGFTVMTADGVPWTGAQPQQSYADALAILGEQLAVGDRPVLTETWTSQMSFEGVSTGDGRFIRPGATQFRPTPLPLMLQTETAPGHMTALLAGAITAAGMSGMTAMGSGDFDDSDVGNQFASIIAARGKFGVSIDVAETDGQPVCAVHGDDLYDCDPDCDIQVYFDLIRVMGLTGTPFPAFENAFIAFTSSQAAAAANVTAAGPNALAVDRMIDDALAIVATVDVLAIPDRSAALGMTLVYAADAQSVKLLTVLGVSDPDGSDGTPIPDPNPADVATAATALDGALTACLAAFQAAAPGSLTGQVGEVAQLISDALTAFTAGVTEPLQLARKDPSIQPVVSLPASGRPVFNLRAAPGENALTFTRQPDADPVTAKQISTTVLSRRAGLTASADDPDVTDEPCLDCGDSPVVAAATAVLDQVDVALPPREWFTDPKFEIGDGRLVEQPDGQHLCPLTVDDPDPETGLRRVYGHMAGWKSCHTGVSNSCVTPPRSKTGYAAFNMRPLMTSDGDIVKVGHLTMGCGHADTSPSMSVDDVRAHYDGGPGAKLMASVVMGEDRFGPWFSGYVSPDATAYDIQVFSQLSVSGDWREVWRGKGLELVACLAGVYVPGFTITAAGSLVASAMADALVASGATPIGDQAQHWLDGRLVSLVAAGVIRQPTPEGRMIGALSATVRDLTDRLDRTERALSVLNADIAERSVALAASGATPNAQAILDGHSEAAALLAAIGGTTIDPVALDAPVEVDA